MKEFKKNSKEFQRFPRFDTYSPTLYSKNNKSKMTLFVYNTFSYCLSSCFDFYHDIVVDCLSAKPRSVFRMIPCSFTLTWVLQKQIQWKYRLRIVVTYICLYWHCRNPISFNIYSLLCNAMQCKTEMCECVIDFWWFWYGLDSTLEFVVLKVWLLNWPTFFRFWYKMGCRLLRPD